MANDRLSVRCKCGEEKLIAKYGGGGDWWGGWRAIGLPEWLGRHLKDCFEHYGEDLAGDPRFSLVTESDPKEPDGE